ncbi:MAG: hypothetical protein Q4B60_05745 [Erysipelotrichaceae bacterium]|nr:hypothetical protein [Erysipelotrichaceae bacterium]
MRDKNIALLGFVSSAAEYLKDVIDEEGEEIKELGEINFDQIKSELSKKIGSSFNTASDNSNDLISAGREIFDEFISKKPTLIDEFEDIFDVDFKKENDEKNAQVTNHLLHMLKNPVEEIVEEEVIEEEEEEVPVLFDTPEFAEIAARLNAIEVEEEEEKKIEIIKDKDEEAEIDSIFTEILSHENNVIEQAFEAAKETIESLDNESITKIIEELETDINISSLNERVEAHKEEEKIFVSNLSDSELLEDIVAKMMTIIENSEVIHLPAKPIIEVKEPIVRFANVVKKEEVINKEDLSDSDLLNTIVKRIEDIVENSPLIHLPDEPIIEEKKHIVRFANAVKKEDTVNYEVESIDVIADRLSEIIENNPLINLPKEPIFEEKTLERKIVETIEITEEEETAVTEETVPELSEEEAEEIIEDLISKNTEEEVHVPLSERLNSLQEEYRNKAIEEVETYMSDTTDSEEILTLSAFLERLKSDEGLYHRENTIDIYNEPVVEEETKTATLSDELRHLKDVEEPSVEDIIDESFEEILEAELEEETAVEEIFEDDEEDEIVTIEDSLEEAELEEFDIVPTNSEQEEAALREFESRTLEQLYIPNPGLDVLEQIEEEQRAQIEQLEEFAEEATLIDEETNQEISELLNDEYETSEVFTETADIEEEAVLEEEELVEETAEEIIEEVLEEETAPVVETTKEFVEVTTAEYNQDDYIAELLNTLNNDTIAKEIEAARAAEEATKNEVYESIRSIYPYLSNGFIRGVYDLKEALAIEYMEGEEIIILHRLIFTEVDGLHRFVEVMIGHGYAVNVDESQMLVDVFKEHINTDGKILTDIFEVANQAKLLTGEYEGYRVIENELVVNQED